uniref:Zinc knuckle CX2CX4HX4C domain-containing protein n=1 Tax=Cannabis sativa TaxID=3483 RepID=A0A803QH18_CANSA
MLQEFSGLIEFENEHGLNVSVIVNYEWKPITCAHCKGMGHTAEVCRKKEGQKQEWVVKHDNRKQVEKKTTPEEFQQVVKGWKPKNTKKPAATKISNGFMVLESEVTDPLLGPEIGQQRDGVGNGETQGGGRSSSFQWIE